MTTTIVVLINVAKIICVAITLAYGFKTMKEVNTNYQHYFGLGIVLLFSALLSIFNEEWIKLANTFLWCIAIYFFLQILKEKNIIK